MLNTVRPYTARCNCFDGFLTDIDQFDIFPVVGLEVVDIDAEPFRADDILRTQRLRCRRIVDGGADLVAYEIGGNVISA